MHAKQWFVRRRLGRFATSLSIVMALVLASATVVSADLASGSLPTLGFTYTSDGLNEVNIAGNGIQFKTKGAVDLKTTYSRVDPSTAFLGGWHFHNGPVFVTVTNGTLTFYGSDCSSWDAGEGETYIETPGQVLNAKALPEKNDLPAGEKVEWFTTRIYPDGAADPQGVTAPCAP
jgi:hypothetical protein